MRLVFVSSTFKDMQSERDALHTRVAPLIDSYLQDFGESVGFGDLRWGVNTSEMNDEDSSNKVLKVCLDRIDDCRPYMIVFIGERYGWIPSKEILENACKLKNIPFENYEGSVTELEIEYGALLNPDYEGRILFYFRDEFDKSKMSEEERKIYESESPYHKKKIDELKEKILKLYPNYVRHYKPYFDEETRTLKGLEEVMIKISEDLKRIFKIDIESEGKIPWQQKAIRNSNLFFENKGKYFYPRKEVTFESSKLDECSLNEANKYNYDYLPVVEYIVGEEGVGKRTLLAYKYIKNKEKDKYVIGLGIGCDRNLLSMEKIIEVLCFYLENNVSTTIDKTTNNIQKLKLLLDAFEKEKEEELHIYLMNLSYKDLWFLNSLALSKEMNERYYLKVHFHVQIKGKLPKRFIKPFPLNSKVLELKEFAKEDIEGVIDALCNKKNKELSKRVKNEIIKLEASSNPLYLSLLVERLCMLDEEDFIAIRKLGDGMDAIDEHLINIVNKSGSNLKEIICNLLNELIERINPLFIKRLIKLFTTKRTFNQYAIEKFFEYKNYEFNELEYTLFVKTFSSLIKLEGENNLFSFTSSSIKKIAKEFIDEVYKEDFIKEIVDWIYTLDFENNFRIKSYINYLFETKDVDLIVKNIIELDIKYKEKTDNKKDTKIITKYIDQVSSNMSDLLDSDNKELALCIIDKILNKALEHEFTIASIITVIGQLDFEQYYSLDTYKTKMDIIEKCKELDPNAKNRFLSVTGFLLSMYSMDARYGVDKMRNAQNYTQYFVSRGVRERAKTNMDMQGVIQSVNVIHSYVISVIEEEEEYIAGGMEALHGMLNSTYTSLINTIKDKKYIKAKKEGKVSKLIMNLDNMLYAYINIAYFVNMYYLGNKKKANKNIIKNFVEFDNQMLVSDDPNYEWFSKYLMPLRKYYIKALKETIKNKKKQLVKIKEQIALQDKLASNILGNTNQYYLSNLLDTNRSIYKLIYKDSLLINDLEKMIFYKNLLEVNSAFINSILCKKKNIISFLELLSIAEKEYLSKEDFYNYIEHALDVYFNKIKGDENSIIYYVGYDFLYDYLYKRDIGLRDHKKDIETIIKKIKGSE